MKWLRTNLKIISIILLCIYPFVSSAQVSDDIDSSKTDYYNGHSYRSIAFRLVPSHYTVQYAGGLGTAVVGAGWYYGQHKRWDSEFLVGYVPKYDTDKFKITLSLRQTYTPWNIDLGERFSYEPLRAGVYINTTLGNQFWVSPPDKYPNDYYKFSTKIRFNFYIGQNFTYEFKQNAMYFDRVKVYYDLHSNELYYMSRRQSEYLKGKNYIGLAIGAQLSMKRK